MVRNLYGRELKGIKEGIAMNTQLQDAQRTVRSSTGAKAAGKPYNDGDDAPAEDGAPADGAPPPAPAEGG